MTRAQAAELVSGGAIQTATVPRVRTYTKAKPPAPPTRSIETFAPLPPGWLEATDPASGNMYYYTEFGDVTWVRPTVSIV